MHSKIEELAEEFNRLSFDVIENGNVVVCDNQNDVVAPLIEMPESEWLANLPAIWVVLDWWINEAGDEHRWAFDETKYDLPTIYMNRDNIVSIDVDSFFYSELQAWHEIDFEELNGLPFITIDEEKAIDWLRMGDNGHTNIDDVEDFTDDLYMCDVHKTYTWANVPLDNWIDNDSTELEQLELGAGESMSDSEAKGE